MAFGQNLTGFAKREPRRWGGARCAGQNTIN